MASMVLPSAVALLAHKRLVDAVEALRRKAGGDIVDIGATGGTAPVVVNDVERRVVELADAARAMIATGPAADVPARLAAGPGLGTWAVLGTAGFELAGYADVFAPGGTWKADALRRGTPDPDLSRVLVPTTQLALRAGTAAVGHAAGDTERAQAQAFAMGLLCAAAGNVVVNPVLRGLHARRTTREWHRAEPAVDLRHADQRAVRELLGAGGAGRWQSWWPASAAVPDALFAGLADAIEETYRLQAARPTGFAAFEEAFAPGDPLDASLLRDGYALFRLEQSVATWGAGAWFGVLAPMLVMPPVAMLLANTLPAASRFFSAGDLTEQSFSELLTLAMSLGSIAPAVYSMILWSQVPRHTDAFANALVLALLRAAVAGAWAGTAKDQPGAGVRWGAFAVPMLSFDVYALIRGLMAGSQRPGARFVFLLQTVPALTGLATIGFSSLTKATGVTGPGGVALGTLLAAAGLLLGVGLPVSLALAGRGPLSFFRRDATLPLIDSVVAASGGAADDPAAPALVFDDSGLWPLAGAGGGATTLAGLAYPSGPRPLLRLWWEGAGDLEARADDHTVTFRVDGGAPQDVALRPGALSTTDVAARLVAALPGLRAEPAAAGDPLYDLPYPATFADPGDDRPTRAGHDAAAAEFRPVGTGRGSAFVLRHTPRVELAVPFGVDGPSASPLDGIAVVPGRHLGDLEETALGHAADLAVLLCLGAAPTLAGARGAPAIPTAPNEVFQVFRQWNLDERRVNEWRMLVAGGAESEKGGQARARDPGMRPSAPTYQANADAALGDRVANAMGWVPMWRAWLRVAVDATADTNAAAAMSYTPAVRFPDGTRRPTNRELSAGVRFLLDLP